MKCELSPEEWCKQNMVFAADGADQPYEQASADFLAANQSYQSDLYSRLVENLMREIVQASTEVSL